MDYQAVPENPEDIRIKRLLDEIYMVDPCLGSRRLVTVLKRVHDVEINRKRLQRLHREIGHEAIWCKPRTSIPDDGQLREMIGHIHQATGQGIRRICATLDVPRSSYINACYNTQRKHSALAYQTPAQFEANINSLN